MKQKILKYTLIIRSELADPDKDYRVYEARSDNKECLIKQAKEIVEEIQNYPANVDYELKTNY